jgi:hypothetical protein
LTDPETVKELWDDNKDKFEGYEGKEEKIFSIRFAFGNKKMMNLLEQRGNAMDSANFEKARKVEK